MKIKPFFVHSRYIPFGGFTCITLLMWVIIRKIKNRQSGEWEKRVIREETKQHETIHVWQQLCLFVVGMAITWLLYAAYAVAGQEPPFVVWLTPAVLPFLAYVLAWVVELALPPYGGAYRDSPFEREAYQNEANENFNFEWFSWVRYFRKDR